jgi:signal transduction histidine kinase
MGAAEDAYAPESLSQGWKRRRNGAALEVLHLPTGAVTFGIWLRARDHGTLQRMSGAFRHRLYWVLCVASVTTWLAMGWPVFDGFASGAHAAQGMQVPRWPGPFLQFTWTFAIYGATLAWLMAGKVRTPIALYVCTIELGCVIIMATVTDGETLAVLLAPVAWQIAERLKSRAALLWIAAQTVTLVGSLAITLPDFDFCYTFGLILGLQFFFVFTAHTLRIEAETSRALELSNSELRAAQALIADNVREAERTRISRELHDEWGHELTAMGLHLEIASHTTEEARAKEGILKARAMVSRLLVKVRDVVSALRDADRYDLKEALDAFARDIPSPHVHVAFEPSASVGAEQTHALVRCAQEAVTNAIRHGGAQNLWLNVSCDERGVTFSAHDDGTYSSLEGTNSHGLSGMRERLEKLGGHLRLEASEGGGFYLEARLPFDYAVEAL